MKLHKVIKPKRLASLLQMLAPLLPVELSLALVSTDKRLGEWGAKATHLTLNAENTNSESLYVDGEVSGYLLWTAQSGDPEQIRHWTSYLVYSFQEVIDREYTARAVTAEALESYREMAILQRATRELNRSLKPENVATALLSELQNLSHPENFGAMFLYQAEQDNYQLLQCFGSNAKNHFDEFSKSDLFKALCSQETIGIINDLNSHPQCKQHNSLLKSVIILPLVSHHERVGLLIIASPNLDEFTAADLKRADTLSTVAAVAIHNAHLFVNLEIKVEERTHDLVEAKKEIEAIHKQTRDSINYASLIQGALLPDEELLANYFNDHFVYWMPKDTVGGDIWLFNELGREDECLLFFIDCTGHGVPGAFVTMIIKAIEREIITRIKDDKEMDVSPSWIMSYFNKVMKVLLKQETTDSRSNAGWDGGIIYYNKKNKILKFAGAETPLFYIDSDGNFTTIKGNRYSVGYKKCDLNYLYKETIIEVQDGMKFYCSTDGYLDQNGGDKNFPFGKKRFTNIIKENYTQPMAKQREIFLQEISSYEAKVENNERNDDMTVICFEI